MEKLKRVIIKEEFVALTGDYIKATILNQFIYWSERVRDFDRYILEERNRAEMRGENLDIKPCNGWIYKSCEELSEEIMIDMSITNMRNHIKKLIQNGWLDERNNPENKWDKTKQYRINLVKIHTDLLNIGYYLQDYKIDMSMIISAEKPQNIRAHVSSHRCDETSLRYNATSFRNDISLDRTVCNVSAIPEITTEITSKITTETTSDNSVSQSGSNILYASNGIGDMTENPPDIQEYMSIISRCELERLEPQSRAAVEEAVKELYFNSTFAQKTLKIPLALVREGIHKLNLEIIKAAIMKMRTAAAGGVKIESSKHYFMTCIYNCIAEYTTDLFSNPAIASDHIYEKDRDILRIVGNTELQGPLEYISSKLPDIAFNSWFKSIVSIKRIENELEIAVIAELNKDILEKRYTALIHEAFKGIGITTVRVKVCESQYPSYDKHAI